MQSGQPIENLKSKLTSYTLRSLACWQNIAILSTDQPRNFGQHQPDNWRRL